MAKLYFYYSAMNAGKTTQLLQSAFNYEERKQKVIRMKPRIDTREGDCNTIESRIGLKSPAEVFSHDTNFLKLMEDYLHDKPAAIFIDEAQFLTKQQVNHLGIIVDILDIPVLCYGIRTDSFGELFPGSAQLLAIGDKLIEIKGICECGSKATMVRRYDENGKLILKGNQIDIGGNDKYVSFCRKHWREAK